MKKIFYKINQLDFKGLFSIFLLSIFGFATLYYMLSQTDQGIHFAYSDTDVGFWTCVYFSIITFTTLGFGDFYPFGLSRALVAVEVILGLMFFGLIISKLTAIKSEYILHRLYSGDIERRLVRFDKKIISLKNELVRLSVCAAENSNCLEIRSRVLSNKDENIYEDLLTLAIGLRKYIGNEVYYGEIFLDISRRTIYRVLHSIISQLQAFNKIYSAPHHDLIRKNANKLRLEKTVRAYFHIAKIIMNDSNDAKTKVKCKEIQRLSQTFIQDLLQSDTLLDRPLS